MNRGLFVKTLDEVRRIRNDVMHFDPEGIQEQDVQSLRDFVRLMRRFAEVGAI